jgi:hypothetical protein
MPDTAEFLKEMMGESDRAAVILCTSVLDDVLLYAIAMKRRARRAAKLAAGCRIPAVPVIYGFAEEGRLMSHAPAKKAASRTSPSGWIRPSCPSGSTPRCFRRMRSGVKARFGTAKTQTRNNRRLPMRHGGRLF